jgi:hypothetical protein
LHPFLIKGLGLRDNKNSDHSGNGQYRILNQLYKGYLVSEQQFPVSCPSCGSNLHRAVHFCPFCGKQGKTVAPGGIPEPTSKATPPPVQPLAALQPGGGGVTQNQAFRQDEHRPAEPAKPTRAEEEESEISRQPKGEPERDPGHGPKTETKTQQSGASQGEGESLQGSHAPNREQPTTVEADIKRSGSRVWMAAAAIICCFLAYFVLHHKSSQAGAVSGGAPGPETPSVVLAGTSQAPASTTHDVTGASPPGAKSKDSAGLALQNVLREGTNLSLVVTKLPKLEKVYKAAQQLGDISPRYQEQVASAEETLKTTKNDRGKILMSYIRKIVELGSFSSEQVSYATGIMAKGDLAPREKLVLDLVQKHVAAVRANSKPDSAGILADFSRAFNEYAD